MSLAEPSLRGDVVIRNLSKSFILNDRRLNVLSGLDLAITPGECLVIVGASGSGKTTLLRILAGLETADFGDVKIDGRPVSGVGSERVSILNQFPMYRRTISMVRLVCFLLKSLARVTSIASAAGSEVSKGIN